MTEHHDIETKDSKVAPTSLHGAIEDLIKGRDYARLMTITAVDVGGKFEIIYHIDLEGRVTAIRVEVPRESPSIPTVTDLIPGALLYEREVRELFGIEFKGHPEPRHLLLPDDWPDTLYPLRKELTIEKIVEEAEKR
jgi:Ni,Fe-hydrogenase III component G